MPEAPFSLISEPWIPVLRRGGSRDALSLLAVLEQSSDVVEILGEVPTQVFAIERLLLAVLHRATGGPVSVADWQAIRDGWPDVIVDVRAYLADYADRFDLRHPVTPFFQVADLRTSKGEPSGLETLIADVPNGMPLFTTRLGSGLERISWAEAARWVVHVQAFDPAGIRSGAIGDPRVKKGKGYPIGPAWCAQLGGVTVVGEGLRETLLLNLVCARVLGLRCGDDDLPAWERAPLGAAEEVQGGRAPTGPVDLYTWQARRVRLIGDDDGVTGVVLTQGDRARPQNRQDVEPMTAWRFSDPQTKLLGHATYMPLTHRPSQVFWRGLSALLPSVESTPGAKSPSPRLQPDVLRWVERLRDAGLVAADSLVRVRATGMELGSNGSVIDEIIDDTLALPIEVLREDAEGLRVAALDAVGRAEHAVDALAYLAADLCAAAGGNETDGPRDRARETAYAELDAPFRQWLSRLGGVKSMLDAGGEWQWEVHQIIAALGRDLIESSSTASWTGREVRGRHLDTGQADALFRAKLATALPRSVVSRENGSVG